MCAHACVCVCTDVCLGVCVCVPECVCTCNRLLALLGLEGQGQQERWGSEIREWRGDKKGHPAIAAVHPDRAGPHAAGGGGVVGVEGRGA